MATELKEAFQDRRARIPAGDPVLRADLHAIQKVVGQTGVPRLVADGETDGHADRFWAGALAVSAARTAYQPYAYHPVPKAQALEDRDFRITAGFGASKGLW
jgi:phage FluMu gp28-like protein